MEEAWESKVVEVQLFPVEVVVLEEEAQKMPTSLELLREVQSRTQGEGSRSI